MMKDGLLCMGLYLFGMQWVDAIFIAIKYAKQKD